MDFHTARLRTARSKCALALALLLASISTSAAAYPAASRAGGSLPDPVWLTLGADAFEVALRALPPVGLEAPLPRLAEADGVVITRVPRAALEPLAERIHAELHRCGGFLVHDTLEEAEAALDRWRNGTASPLALPFTIDEPDWVATVAGGVQESQILATMTALSTQFANRSHAGTWGTAAANWIHDQWAGLAAGRPDVTVELYSHGGITPQPSVVLTIPGTTLPDEIVVIGGHEDSITSDCWSDPDCVAPGADDNGSGIAVLSEVVRAALAGDFRPQRTVQFMAYAAEEVGLFGSDDIASDYNATNADVVGVLQMDMTGYHGSVEDVVMISDHVDPELTAFLEDLLDAYQPGLLWTTDFCGYACSDHASWNAQGYRSSFAFESRFGEDDPWIHTSFDLIDNLVGGAPGGAAHAARFARLAAAFLVEASLDGPVLPFRDGFESGGTTRWTSTIP